MSREKKPKKENQNAHDDIQGSLDFMGMSPRYKFLAIKLIWLHHLREPKNSFKSAVQATPLLKDVYKDGLQALGNYSNKVTPSNTKKCEGSVDIDAAVRSVYPNACRWDYVVGYDDRKYFIEVHSAKTDEVKAVLNKLRWLKDFLVKDAPELNKGKKSFHWIASNGNHILPNSPQARQLAQKGIEMKIVGQLHL